MPHRDDFAGALVIIRCSYNLASEGNLERVNPSEQCSPYIWCQQGGLPALLLRPLCTKSHSRWGGGGGDKYIRMDSLGFPEFSWTSLRLLLWQVFTGKFTGLLIEHLDFLSCELTLVPSLQASVVVGRLAENAERGLSIWLSNNSFREHLIEMWLRLVLLHCNPQWHKNARFPGALGHSLMTWEESSTRRNSGLERSKINMIAVQTVLKPTVYSIFCCLLVNCFSLFILIWKRF